MPSILGTEPGVHYKSLKTVNQSLKHKVNRCVLSLRLNECKLSASRTAAGRLFHTTGPATEKALSSNFVLVRSFKIPSRTSISTSEATEMKRLRFYYESENVFYSTFINLFIFSIFFYIILYFSGPFLHL